MNPERTPSGSSNDGQRLDWTGTTRYEVRRCIGAGSMGTVYEAFDRERGQAVALKKLRFFSPATLYLFKQEFRTLADVVHPNLVRLHELVATEARDVFFTMELVRGADFVAHVRAADAGERGERVRAGLRQLVEGVHALHAHGKLHRDIKPSNVLVTPEGRVVLLDFGVATDLARVEDEGFRDEEPIVGTASYMAPEQAAGAAPTAACDWYGVGAILFEALVGSAPFLGSVTDVLRLKSTTVPPLPSACEANVPPDLDALCGTLLSRTPEERPTGPEILRRLGVVRYERARSPLPSLADSGLPARLVGRHEQHAALRDAFAAARSGKTVVVPIGGPSGMGKSSLVQEFVDGLATRAEAIVLRGRAYERESVPYKAIDSWVDALSRHLLRLSDRGAEITLPNDVWALARLFPVLRRVPEVADRREELVSDPHRLRRRAFGALRELLASLSQKQPVVVCIDDAHWGDADSAALLLDLVRPPQAPPLLIVMTFRDDAADASPFLIETANWPEGVESRPLTVGPLDDDDARRLALALLGSDDETAQAVARAMARESQGSPFLLEELVRDHQATVGSDVSGVVATLGQSVAERLTRLPDDVRVLLTTIAVGGRPMDVATVAQAAGIVEGVEDAMALLRTRRFVRAGLRNGREVVETTHERIRDAIVSGLSTEMVRWRHEAIARALESAPDADPEAVTVHLVGAGDQGRAAPYAERAAERAIGKLAFDRAVQLFRIALDGAPDRSPSQAKLRVRLAESLALAGRGGEAARSYLESAERLDADRVAERRELERAAAEQLLGSGRIDEGAEVLHRVLAATGMKAPRSTLSALFWLVVYQGWLRVMGLRFTAREPHEVAAEDRARIEAMYAVGMGFAIVDFVIGACMQARLLILALRAGDRLQVLRATALEAAQLATRGREASKRERALFTIADKLAARCADVEPRAFVEGAHGFALLLRGRWTAARAAFDASNAKTMTTRSYWYSNANLFAVHALYFSGEFKELARRQARLCADARDRGDLYTTVNFATTTSITERLIADDPDGARRLVREATNQWSQRRFFVQHWQAMAFEPDIDLYLGRGAAAYDRLRRDMRGLRRSLLGNVQFIRAMTAYTQGRCAVGSIAERPATREARIAEARRAAYRLEREKMPWTAPLAALVRACAENAAGNPGVAVGALRAAIDGADAADMVMHAVAARYRLGELLKASDRQDEGASLVAEAARAMTSQGIRDPARWVAVYLPGSWGV